MKVFNLNNFLFAFFLLALGACSEKDRAFPEYEDLQKGALPRLVDGVNGGFDFDNIDGSGIDFTVEFYDEDNGANVSSYSWTAVYGDLGPVNIISVNSSQFSPNADGLPQVSINIPFSTVLGAFGLDQNGIVPGQAFELIGTVTRNDGTSFTNTTTISNAQAQPLFQGLFFIRQGVDNVPCYSRLAGTFEATATAQSVGAGIGWDDCDGSGWTGTVIWEAEHDPTVFGTGTYKVYILNAAGDMQEDVSMGAYDACYMPSATGYPLGDVRINDDCETMFWTGTSQWGEVYEFRSIAASGADLTIEWRNDYGEAGKVKLTRTDGENWPAGLKF